MSDFSSVCLATLTDWQRQLARSTREKNASFQDVNSQAKTNYGSPMLVGGCSPAGDSQGTTGGERQDTGETDGVAARIVW